VHSLVTTYKLHIVCFSYHDDYEDVLRDDVSCRLRSSCRSSKVQSSSNLRQKTVLRKAMFTEKTIGLQNTRDIYLGNNSKVNEFIFHNTSFLHHRLIRWYSFFLFRRTPVWKSVRKFFNHCRNGLVIKHYISNTSKTFSFYISPVSLLVFARHTIPEIWSCISSSSKEYLY
jgi:hypothetical protein